MDEATVVGRGQRVRVWFVSLGDGWVRATDHPDANLEEVRADRQDQRCPPGTIWQRHVELMLEAGTPLYSRVTTPLVEDLRPLDYLEKERKNVRRHLEETWFVVSGNYKLEKRATPPPFARARKALPDDDAPPLVSPGRFPTERSRG